MAHTGLTCGELVELITAYLDDALSPDRRSRFEQHLVTCADCQGHLAAFRETIRLTGRLAEESIDTRTRETLMRAFRDWKLAR